MVEGAGDSGIVTGTVPVVVVAVVAVEEISVLFTEAGVEVASLPLIEETVEVEVAETSDEVAVATDVVVVAVFCWHGPLDD